jgi:rubrerythrin
MKEVIESLKESIYGELEANEKYKLYAEKALNENLPTVANLFKAISFAEEIHVKNHVNALSKITNSPINVDLNFKINRDDILPQVKSTRVNLLNARVSESFEYKKKYKNFKNLAKKEGNKLAELAFNYARNAEKIHAKLFSDFLKIVDSKKAQIRLEFFVCTNCGNVEIDEIPEICPICGKDRQKYKTIA